MTRRPRIPMHQQDTRILGYLQDRVARLSSIAEACTLPYASVRRQCAELVRVGTLDRFLHDGTWWYTRAETTPRTQVQELLIVLTMLLGDCTDGELQAMREAIEWHQQWRSLEQAADG